MSQTVLRPSGRAYDELRPIHFIREFTKNAAGSVLVSFGHTKVLCTASVIEGVPRFLRDSNQGWLTAEYGMLPGSTHERVDREAARGKQSGRTVEIQRLIGRALRGAVDLTVLKDYTLAIDCDVLQADGGTRTAAINGASVALADALNKLTQKKVIKTNPLKHLVAAVSVGIFEHTPVLDLDYAEDSKAHTDMNIVMTDSGSFLELQGTAEGVAFDESELSALIGLAKQGISQILTLQRQVLEFV